MHNRAASQMTGTSRPEDPLQRLIRDTEQALIRANQPLTSKPAEFFYSTVLDTFQPREKTGVFSGDRVPSPVGDGNYSSLALCVRALLPYANPTARRLLDMALFSLLTLYLGRLTLDAKMTDMARSAYTSTIRDFRHAIGSTYDGELTQSQIERGQLFLALSTVLQLFEVSLTFVQAIQALTKSSSSMTSARQGLDFWHITTACSRFSRWLALNYTSPQP
jgi:hypothetical protein